MRKPARSRLCKLAIPEYDGQVSFQETLSALVDTVYEEEKATMKNPSVFKDLEDRKGNIKSLRKAQSQVKKSGRGMKEDGSPFTVEESTASLMMQSIWRGHEGRKKKQKGGKGGKGASVVEAVAEGGGAQPGVKAEPSA